MKTAKKQVVEILEELPEDSTLEEIQYQIYLRDKIQKGLDDVSEGNVINHEEVKKRMDKWAAR